MRTNWKSSMVLCLGALFITGTCFAQTITTFDIPDSFITHPMGINAAGQITGWFNKPNELTTHAFLREKDGSFTTFDVPDLIDTNFCRGALLKTEYVSAVAITPAGQITGNYWSYGRDINTGVSTGCNRNRGFLRQHDGTITPYDVLFPDSDTSVYQTRPMAMNPAGQIVGAVTYSNGASPVSAFLRQPDGTIIAFDVGNPNPYVTVATAINAAGDIIGYFAREGLLGFLRLADGSVTTFIIDGYSGYLELFPNAINSARQITGYYSDALGKHGFLREPDGSLSAFDVPKSSGTIPVAIGPKGAIAGYYVDPSYFYHAFVRERDGTITTFDVPNSIYTYPTAMSPSGEIAGWYADANYIVHGFVRSK